MQRPGTHARNSPALLFHSVMVQLWRDQRIREDKDSRSRNLAMPVNAVEMSPRIDFIDQAACRVCVPGKLRRISNIFLPVTPNGDRSIAF
jgi:hypothetical protein